MGSRWLLGLCERVRLLQKLDSDELSAKPPPGAWPLTQDEETREPPPDTDLETLETLALATEIAQRGFQWRDEETRRLADRATSLLSAASVVLGLGTAFAQAGFAANALAKGLLIAALVAYLILALLMVLALRPRPLLRDSGYAVKYYWANRKSLHRRHQQELLKRVEQLDTMTEAKACMVAIGAVLLALEVLLLTLAIIVTIQESAG